MGNAKEKTPMSNETIKKLVANAIAEKLDHRSSNFNLSFVEKFNELLKSDEYLQTLSLFSELDFVNNNANIEHLLK